LFTCLNDPAVEAGLQKQLDIIVRETVRTFGSDCTIILGGGFGRGEGSIRFVEKTPIPLHDFDLYVVTDRKIDTRTSDSMQSTVLKQLSQLTGYDLAAQGFVLGVEVVPLNSLPRLPPDLSTYEMKASSTVLYGHDIRSRIPIIEDDVALASGAITLFHRTTALLKNVEPEYLVSGEYPVARRLEAVYECCKVYTEICTALSLLGGFYEPSYRARALRFRQNYRLFPDLQKDLPDLADLVSAHTHMKLFSDFSSIIREPVDSWIKARRALEVSLRFFLSKFLGIGSQKKNWPSLSHEAVKRMRWVFFEEYISYYLERLGVRGAPLVHAANVLFQAYDFQSFKGKARKFGRDPSSNIFSFTSPIINVYLSSALILFSLLDDGRIDDDLLKAGRKYLENVFLLREDPVQEERLWKMRRDDCVAGQWLYFGIKQQKMVY